MPVIRYEAEDAAIHGALIKSHRPGASNSYVDYMNNTGDYIEWSVNAATSGNYDLSFRYGLGDSTSRSLQLSVNGVVSSELLTFGSTGSWDQWQTIQKNLALQAGNNAIRLEAVGNSGPNIDYLEIDSTSTGGGGSGGGGSGGINTILEAENAVIVGAAIKNQHAGASNAYVDYANNTGDYIQWTVNLEQAGNYNLAFQYALASGSRSMQLMVNGQVQSGTVDFSATGAWNQWQSAIETLSLNAGNNTIRLLASGESGPNIDYLKVTSASGGGGTGGGGGNTDTVFEAENAIVVGAEIKSHHAGASNAYVDYANNTGDYIEWTVDREQAGNYNLAFQYALASGARSMQLIVNGQVQSSTANFSATGAWDQWQSMIKTVSLNAGTNKIRLEAIGDSGPNIDYLKVTSASGGGDPGGGGGDGLDIAFNFQNNTAPIPSGYIKDYGQAYDNARGYGWITEQSVSTGSAVPLAITTSGRDRNITGYDQRVDTFMHMEDFDAGFSAAWEYAIPNGTYAVTVSVGDPIADDTDAFHTINAEGQTIINRFLGTPKQAFAVETAIVNVNDGKLTIDSIGGDKTKINFIEIEEVHTGQQPTIASASPVDNATDVNRSTAVTFDVSLVEIGVGVSGASLSNATVSLYKTNGLSKVQGNLNTSGGGDTIIFKPASALEANTHYTMMIDGVTDANGTEFIPYTTSFTTGSAMDSATADYDITVAATGEMAITLLISPDNKYLYASSVNGKILRWNIDQQTGALSNKQTFLGLQDDPAAPSAIIGLAFDPDDPSVLWVSHNASYFTHAEDFTGQISKLHLGSGTGFNPTVEEYIVGLPRSNHDHMTNSLSFGPNGNLYVTQGSNTAMGALDTAWGDRNERALTAAMLEINPNINTNGTPINVQTENYVTSNGTVTHGNYNPFASGAPVTVYATGLRNAYDHVWHSNGHLYAPDNGSAAGGVVPDDPNTSINENIHSVHSQHDVLYEIDKGGYYGHPNILRGEYILRGGNPTTGIDPGEVSARNGFKGYPVGVMPDPDYKTHIFDFGDKQSADGIIELKTNAYGSSFQNSLLVTRYSAANDIVSVRLDANGNVVNSAIFADNLVNPLDLIEHTPSGRIYLAEFRGFESKISMLSPTGSSANLASLSSVNPVNESGASLLGIHEAEDAVYSGPLFRDDYTGYTGTGFLDFTNLDNDFIEWSVDCNDPGMYELSWRYALYGSSRPLDVYINGELVADMFNFISTGDWTFWEENAMDAELKEGVNTIRLEADGFSGANFDSLIISEAV